MPRVRWASAALHDDRTVDVEYWSSPDTAPHEAVLDDHPGSIGLVLTEVDRPQMSADGRTGFIRLSLERHVASVRLPFPARGREVRDVKPRRPADGITVTPKHRVHPDETNA